MVEVQDAEPPPVESQTQSKAPIPVDSCHGDDNHVLPAGKPIYSRSVDSRVAVGGKYRLGLLVSSSSL